MKSSFVRFKKKPSAQSYSVAASSRTKTRLSLTCFETLSVAKRQSRSRQRFSKMDSNCQEYTSSWNRMYNEHIERDDMCAVVTNYDNYAKNYERDCTTLKFSLPNVVTQLLMDHMPENLFESKTVAAIDIAAGTGLMGESMRRAGFNGIIDGVDGSQEMLNQACTKNIYRNLEKLLLVPETPMPIADNQYDALTCIAALSQGHVRPELLAEFARIAKSGALIVFTVRNNLTNQAYIEELNEIVAAMEENKTWTKVMCFNAEQYGLDLASTDSRKASPMYSLVYCYKKL